MDNEVVEFDAGQDTHGLRRWVAGLVMDREDRGDGVWVKVLPAESESDEDSRWVRDSQIRRPRS